MNADRQPDDRGALRQLRNVALALALIFPVHPAADVTMARASMENPDNPLLRVETARGELFLELFTDSAPRNVERFLALAEAEWPVTDPVSGETGTPHYYDGLSFHRIVPGTLIQAGRPFVPERGTPENAVPHEINAQGLDLHEQPIIDETGTPHPWLNIRRQEDFQQQILIPLYREMNIDNREQLQARESEVLQRLQQMNLEQAYTRLGYRYDSSLTARRPRSGSVMMVADGPGGNTAQFFINLVDTPWLIGRNTVIGQVVSGMEVVQQINNSAGGQSPDTTIYRIRQVQDDGTLPTQQ